MRLTALLLLLAMLIANCSGGKHQKTRKPNQVVESAPPKQTHESTSDVDSTYKVTFKRDASYGSTSKLTAGEIATFTVDDRSRVFIADENQTDIHVFNPDGSYLTSLGRKGRGPGEFGAISKHTTMVIHSKQLLTDTEKYFANRIQVFSLKTLSFFHTVGLIPANRNDYKELKGYYPIQIYPRNNRRFLVAYRQPPYEYKAGKSFIYYMIQDEGGTILSGPILKQKDLTNLVYFVKNAQYPYLAIHSFPFYGKSLLSVSGKDYLYAANNTDEFKINIYDSSGRRIQTFKYAFNKKKFNKDRIINRYKKTNYMSQLGPGIAIKMIHNAGNLPKTWPAIQSMFLDDKNRLWISTIIDNSSVYEWWVLKKSGDIITKFKWSKDKPIKVVRNGYMYTLETDPQTGLQRVVRYQIIWKS